MWRITAVFLWIFSGCPVRTIFFRIILSGFTECNEPVATKADSVELKTRIGAKRVIANIHRTLPGGKVIGP